MQRRRQFTLRGLFLVIGLAALVAWTARLSIELALILAGSLVGAIVPRRFIGSLLGGTLGAVAVCLVIFGPPVYRLLPGTGLNYRPWQSATGALRAALVIAAVGGAFLGYGVGYFKELMRYLAQRRAESLASEANFPEQVPRNDTPTGDRHDA